MHGRSTALAVGVVHVLPQLRKMPEWLMTKMYDSVYSHRVRCFTGTFGLDAKQMASFAQKFPMATRRPVCQMWRGGGPYGQSTDVFPSYTLLLGDSSNTTITDELLESAVAVRNNWVSTMYPYDEIMPYWRRMSRAQLEQSAAYDTDWGHVKVKPVATDRWIPHVHQVVFWCGTAQQGAMARNRELSRNFKCHTPQLRCEVQGQSKEGSCGHAASSSKANPQVESPKANPRRDVKAEQ